MAINFKWQGFTLIEVLVVMAIVAMLLSLVTPKYFATIDKSKESILRHDLATMRDALDKFYSDNGEYPNSLDGLVTKHYLREVPADPITNSVTTWVVVASEDLEVKGAVFNVYSGAQELGSNGIPYNQW